MSTGFPAARRLHRCGWHVGAVPSLLEGTETMSENTLGDTLRLQVEKQAAQAHNSGRSYVMLDLPTADDLISALKQASAFDVPLDHNEISVMHGDAPQWLTSDDVSAHWSDPEPTA